MIAYGYPPIGGPGALRISKYSYYLPESGWRPTVVTALNGYNPVGKLPIPHNPLLTIRRVNEIDPVKYLARRHLSRTTAGSVGPRQTGSRSIRRLYRGLAFPDRDSLWIPHATRVGSELICDPQRHFSAIFSSSPNISNHVAAMRLKRSYGIPWLAEFRDMWALSDTRPRRAYLRSRLESWLEQLICRQADHIVVVSRECRELLVQQYNMSSSRISVIHNGFDPVDYASLELSSEFPKFSLAHAGSFCEGVRDPTPFFIALCELRDAEEIELADMSLEFYGLFDATVSETLVRMGLAGSAKWHGYLPYNAMIEELSRAYVLLSIAASDTVVNTKVFDYMGCQRPVLALGKRASTLDQILSGTGMGAVIDHGDISSLKEAIARLWRAWKSGASGWTGTDVARLEQYTRPALTRQLAFILARLSGSA